MKKGEGMDLEVKSRYTAHQPDAQGFIAYSAEENHVWQQLFARQKKILHSRASEHFLNGLDALQLTEQRIPQ